ncbi:MAG: UMP kinase [Candidatus Asgardarchaeia archaeon]
MGGRIVVLKIGGSLLYDEGLRLKTKTIKGIVDSSLKFVREGNDLGIVVGGGKLSRLVIEEARRFGLPEAICDQIGISISRINAKIIAHLLGEVSCKKVPESWDEFLEFLNKGKVLVLGGMNPGQSTNAVAAIMAEMMGAELLVNLSDVGGIYDRDPKDPNAKLLDRISSSDLMEMLVEKESKAGSYELFDLVALKILMRSKIPMIFTDGRDKGKVYLALKGREVGTLVYHDE